MAATHIFDIDGTIVNFHTNDWLPGAKEYIQKLYRQGCRIIFITQRGFQSETRG
jgi:ribonucleotide monophosphatase NagD (HAD superfamily)